MIGKIYTMTCPVTHDIIYVGSTVQPLKVRLSLHLNDSKNSNSPLKKYIRDMNIVPSMELIEEIDVLTENQLRIVEYYWIDQFRQWGFRLKNMTHNKSHKYVKVPFFRGEVLRNPVNVSRESFQALKILAKKGGYIMSRVADEAIKDRVKDLTGMDVFELIDEYKEVYA